MDLKPDATWKALSLPEKTPLANWWLDQERQRGYALSLERLVGSGRSYQGIATLQESKPRKVFFNSGAQLETIWLNGQRIYKAEGWRGWHAGRERVPALLRNGKNTLVIETGATFFLSVTDDNSW